MARRLAGLLCCVLLAVAASAQPEKDEGNNAKPTSTYLADALLKSKGLPVKATTASGYYGYSEPETATLTQANFKQCRVTTCFGTGCASSFAFQTDFQCPTKDQQHHGHGTDPGAFGFSSTVGTCDWEISILRWQIDEMDAITYPMTISDGVLKYGTAWGTCYLTAEAENCDSPLCDRMAISVQGGLYATNAYSYTSATSEQARANLATLLDACAGEAPPVLRRRPAQPGAAGDRVEEEPISFGWFLDFLLLLIKIALYLLTGTGISPWTPGPYNKMLVRTPGQQAAPVVPGTQTVPGAARVPPSAAQPVEAKIAYEHEHQHYEREPARQLYSGVALVISGPFYEISHHDSDIQQTGLFELPLYFEGTTSAGTEPTSNWPIVQVKSAKLRFNRKKPAEYYGNEGGRA